MNEAHRHTISPEQLKMLRDIFRLIPREIETEEDIQKLAPGEMGINYNDGALYFRNPKTGDVFSPNSVEHIRQIMECWDPQKRRLNADTVGYIKFYSHVHQLNSAQANLTVDTVFRDMEYPSVLMSPIKYTDANYYLYGYPTPVGTLIVYKMSEYFAYAMYIDSDTSAVYHSIYRPDTHMMTGWHITTGYGYSAVTLNGGLNVKVRCVKESIEDLEMMQLYVKHQIYPAAHLSVNGKTGYPIINEAGEPLSVAVPENNTIVLIFDERKKCWVCCPVQEDAQQVTIRIMRTRLDNVTENVIQNIKVTQTISDHMHIATTDDEHEFPVTELAQGSTLLDVNYGQTVLRNEIDYVHANGKIQLTNISLKRGDVIHYRMITLTVSV